MNIHTFIILIVAQHNYLYKFLFFKNQSEPKIENKYLIKESIQLYDSLRIILILFSDYVNQKLDSISILNFHKPVHVFFIHNTYRTNVRNVTAPHVYVYVLKVRYYFLNNI